MSNPLTDVGKSEKVIRIKHESDFTIIGNSALQDGSLSWTARGLLAYMLSLPPGWNIHERELLAHTTDKRLATHNAMKELIQAGYVFKKQGKDFRNETYFFVSDSKTTRGIAENQPRHSRKSDQPLAENQPRGIVENQQLQSTHIQINNKKKQIKERGEKPPPPGISLKFKEPTFEEVKAYCEERKNSINPGRFINFYESKGWMIGKNKMKDWKAAIKSWESTEEKEKQIPSLQVKKSIEDKKSLGGLDSW
jgi:hypothetical protein